MQKSRDLLWPRRGFTRVVSYFRHRIVRLPDTPHRIAAGVAAGVAASLTPFIGLHFILAFTIAWITRGNLIASAIGTVVGNPWTFPLIWVSTYELGATIIGVKTGAKPPLVFEWQGFIHDPMGLLALLWPMLLGALPLAFIAWWLTYLPLRRLVGYYRARRAERRVTRARMGSGTELA